jgi:hypothetical protein
MSSNSKKTEGGSGGKLGHSNMTHWEYTEVIKKESRKIRRRNNKKEVESQIKEISLDHEKTIQR